FSPNALQVYEASGRCLVVNPAFVALFGSAPPPEYNVLQDDIAERNGVLDLIHRAFAGETVTVGPMWYDLRELRQVPVREGRRVAVSSTFFPLFDREGRVGHVGIVFKDLTPEMEAREQAEQERDLPRAIFMQSGDGIVVCDAEGIIRGFNPEAARQPGAGRIPRGCGRGSPPSSATPGCRPSSWTTSSTPPGSSPAPCCWTGSWWTWPLSRARSRTPAGRRPPARTWRCP